MSRNGTRCPGACKGIMTTTLIRITPIYLCSTGPGGSGLWLRPVPRRGCGQRWNETSRRWSRAGSRHLHAVPLRCMRLSRRDSSPLLASSLPSQHWGRSTLSACPSICPSSMPHHVHANTQSPLSPGRGGAISRLIAPRRQPPGPRDAVAAAGIWAIGERRCSICRALVGLVDAWLAVLNGSYDARRRQNAKRNATGMHAPDSCAAIDSPPQRAPALQFTQLRPPVSPPRQHGACNAGAARMLGASSWHAAWEHVGNATPFCPPGRRTAWPPARPYPSLIRARNKQRRSNTRGEAEPKPSQSPFCPSNASCLANHSLWSTWTVHALPTPAHFLSPRRREMPLPAREGARDSP
jgi:hypothetical protein